MRIAVVNWSRRELGGAESYLRGILPWLRVLGHEIAFWSELDQPADRDLIPLPEGTSAWCAAELGWERALAALRDWAPDLLYVHVTSGPDTEAAVLELAPAVLFAHAYYGTCISGGKTLKSPVPTPCGHRFGAACLLRYYPRRCGGLSPLTMVRDFRKNARRRDLLPAYRAVVTGSAHMRDEYVRHGCDPARVHAVPLPVDGPARAAMPVPPGGARGEWRLLFAGRMDRLKGGRTLMEALPLVAGALRVPLRVTLAGDGPDRAEWERRAEAARARAGEGLSVHFTGWQSGPGLEALRDRADLLVVPSLWPEPFGLVGPEAGLRGVPAAAFAVGGIPDWLVDGVNGHLAPADPPTAAGLAAAIVRCLRDPAEHAALREGALRVARRFNRDAHLHALAKVFEEAAGSPQPVCLEESF